MIRPLPFSSVKQPFSTEDKQSLSKSLLTRTVPDANYHLARRGPPMPFLQPRPEDIDLMQFMRKHASSLDRDALWLKSLAKEADDLKVWQRAGEEYAHSLGIRLALQLIREYDALSAGRIKR